MMEWLIACYLSLILHLYFLLFCATDLVKKSSVRPFSYFFSNGKHRRDIWRKRALSHGDLRFEGEEILLLIAQRASLQAVRVGARVAAVEGITMGSVVRKINRRVVPSACLLISAVWCVPNVR